MAVSIRLILNLWLVNTEMMNDLVAFYGDRDRDSIFYKSDDMRDQSILFVEDYIDIGVFNDDDEELYMKKHKITSINNKLSIVLDEKPYEVVRPLQ